MRAGPGRGGAGSAHTSLRGPVPARLAAGLRDPEERDHGGGRGGPRRPGASARRCPPRARARNPARRGRAVPSLRGRRSAGRVVGDSISRRCEADPGRSGRSGVSSSAPAEATAPCGCQGRVSGAPPLRVPSGSSAWKFRWVERRRPSAHGFQMLGVLIICVGVFFRGCPTFTCLGGCPTYLQWWQWPFSVCFVFFLLSVAQVWSEGLGASAISAGSSDAA